MGFSRYPRRPSVVKHGVPDVAAAHGARRSDGARFPFLVSGIGPLRPASRRMLRRPRLAHTLGSKVQAAYQRGDLLERRRKLMDTWATFCARPQMDAEVVPLRRAAADAL